MANKLTHDGIRRNGGPWRCMNCGKESASITDLNETECPKQPKDNQNVIDVITDKDGKFQ